ncbi:MAG: hypothetical protein COW32_07010 [Candidatus Aquicultor secundus]|uniref:FHA domain-containing protein n=1 Tax=Candidatus Aquicultor secundus TaxID=1973895 RepID=A0A2M7T730_9ACTN|nr:DUF3662 and FHA domain-containing protein [Candidatus Aquicultor secundus]NCO65094.1 DUF3662 and FHA domain-containing protein [Solirubrobacter sp.]OIO88233.1 MAG: hypothetical protein AUK32_02000 [Candidatus Aquicultor secundus]PIU27859.1 MAG: hypothetical protein COT10_01260 [Candidatus Aquicultor secundus]PIW21964.1 MAG: hypothetical protein COW32_07010 [Candidatus Aquicultor secundus]PIX51356.1 MAG: hypothetical protein COZ51_10170 [Candidatus Aquicultor secundus]
MSVLKDFEHRLEALFEGFFAKQFKSGIQPVEIAKKLVREMDAHRTISVSKLYVPNRYSILISEADAERIKPFETTLVSEFQSFLIAHAKKEGYELLGRPQIAIKAVPRLSLGEVLIESTLESREPGVEKEGAGDAYLVRSGAGGETKFLLADTTIKIGRAADNHIIISDPNVSRYHARIESVGAQHLIKDLESTNGTFVNGAKVDERRLKNGDTIAIGTTKLYFRREAGV